MAWKYTKTIVGLTLVGGLAAGAYASRDTISRLLHGQEGPAAAATPGRQQNLQPTDLQDIVKQVYQQSRPKTPDDLVEQAGQLQNELVLFAYQHSQEIVQGAYDQQLRQLGFRIADFFGDLEQQGRQLHGKLGEKLQELRQDLRREICQPEIEQLARGVYALFDAAFTAESRKKIMRERAAVATTLMDDAERQQYAGEVLQQLPAPAYQGWLRGRGLEQTLQDMEQAFGVRFARDSAQGSNAPVPQGPNAPLPQTVPPNYGPTPGPIPNPAPGSTPNPTPKQESAQTEPAQTPSPLPAPGQAPDPTPGQTP